MCRDTFIFQFIAPPRRCFDREWFFRYEDVQDKKAAGFFMSKTYSIFGLSIRSEIDLPAPEARVLQQPSEPDVVIEYGEVPPQLARPQKKTAWYEAAPGEFLLRAESIARYYVQGGGRIVITAGPGVEKEKILIFLMGSAMGALLHQRNVLVLHAGAVTKNNSSAIFLGSSGAGKSTLAAAFHQRGLAFLADDVCAIGFDDGFPAVIPGFPRLKLWEDALEKLGKDKDGLKKVVWIKNLEKYFMPVVHEDDRPVRLKNVFSLEAADTEHIEISLLRGGAKLDPLMANTYRPGFLDGLGGKREYFRQCARVAAQTSVYRVLRPRENFLLDELADVLEAKF